MKILKWILGILGTLAALFVLALIYLFVFVLPSPGQIGRAISSPSTMKQLAKGPAKPAAEKTAMTSPESAAPAEAAEEGVSKDGNISMKGELGQKVFRDLMDSSVPMTSFCSVLGRPSSAGRKISVEEFGRLFGEQYEKGSSDPAMEAFMPFIRQFFRYDETRALFQQIDDAQKNGDSGFLGKAQFYGSLALAYDKLTASKKDFDDIGDRTYHMMMLARAVEKHPELARDANVGDYCRQIERALNDRAAFGGADEKKAFQDFLKQTGVSPQEIGYDPNYKTQINFERKEGSLKLKGGWLESWIQLDQTRPQ